MVVLVYSTDTFIKDLLKGSLSGTDGDTSDHLLYGN